jgi:hypothetical protein
MSCSVQKEIDNAIYDVYYEAKTRGSFINIHFKEHTIAFKSATEDKSMVLSKIEASTINEIISKIKLSEISNLKAPSDKRFYDGALIGNFTIKKNDTSYVSSAFDHGNPPKELLALFNKLQSFIK